MTLKEKLEQYIDPQIDVIHLEQVADDYVIEVLEWLTNEKSEYSIMYGNQEKRFL